MHNRQNPKNHHTQQSSQQDQQQNRNQKHEKENAQRRPCNPVRLTRRVLKKPILPDRILKIIPFHTSHDSPLYGPTERRNRTKIHPLRPPSGQQNILPLHRVPPALIRLPNHNVSPLTHDDHQVVVTPMDTTARFIHLHLHTEYSLLDGGNRIGTLVARIKELGMNAVAVTDHGNLYGAVQFYTKAKAAGVKPILGIEAYVAVGDRTVRVQTGVADGGFHLVLLAENLTGWQHLLKLSSDSFINGFYYKPRMDHSTLEQWSDGLIAINGHLGSSIAYHLLRYAQSRDEAAYNAAKEEAQWHKETFGTNENGDPCFYLELQRHGTPAQETINPFIIQLAKELSIPLVCDNDAHFLNTEDADLHDTLCCISMSKTKDEEGRLNYSPELYVKSPEQMAELFSDVPEAVENTARIADRCNVELDFDSNHTPIVIPEMPEKDIPYKDGDRTKWYESFCAQYTLHPFDSTKDSEAATDHLETRCDETLRRLAENGLIWRYGPDGITQEIKDRLERELDILARKSISAYFLIVWDFVNWARQNGTPANARGSGVGTMVGYALGLSNACPVEYGLLFERFTDPDRSEYPDIDIDICQEGRPKVIDYVRQKYGHVAQIITFGTLKARAAIKDVGRVYGFSPSETQRLANLIPDQLNITIDEAIEKEPDLRNESESRPEVGKLLDNARRLEGQVRHSGVHAAGVVIATQPLDNIIPLARPSSSNSDQGDLVTQWDGPTVDRIGLLKMDFLGLRTLTTIERCKQLVRESMSNDTIRETLGIDDPKRDPLDLSLLSYDDPKVLSLFQHGDTAGLFQFESGGMRRLLMDMKPDRLEDLIAANALFRPGPMELIPDYNRRKHGQERVPEIHPIVDQYTAETYGIMVYQEQVMQICHELGGIPLRQAYTLIKAISKKKQDVINAQRPIFIEGAIEKGLKRTKADELFDLILKFAGYGFNKSHSTGYSIIAYETGYLKAYFPNQYMASVLTFESAARKVSDWIGYLDECKRTTFPDCHEGVEVRPPDINLSEKDFSVVFEENEPRDNNHGHVRFGLAALKGAGAKAINAIVQERAKHGPFTSLYDFCERVPHTIVNRATIESLIKAGAFDSLYDGREKRAALIEAIESSISAGQALAADRASGQGSLFGGGAPDDDSSTESKPADPPLPRIIPWTDQEALTNEKETLGFYISGHPLDQWTGHIKTFSSTTIKKMNTMSDRAPAIIAGVITGCRSIFTKTGKKMAMLSVEDLESHIDGVIFSDAYAEYGELLHEGSIVFLAGAVDKKFSGSVGLRVDKVIPIQQAPEQLAGAIDINLSGTPDEQELTDTLNHLTGVLKQHSKINGSKGNPVLVRVHLHIESKHIILEPMKLRVAASNQLLTHLHDLLGPNSCSVAGADANTICQQAAPPRRRS